MKRDTLKFYDESAKLSVKYNKTHTKTSISVFQILTFHFGKVFFLLISFLQFEFQPFIAMTPLNKKFYVKRFLVSIIVVLILNRYLGSKPHIELSTLNNDIVHEESMITSSACDQKMSEVDKICVSDKVSSGLSQFHMQLTDQIDERIKYLNENKKCTKDEYNERFKLYIPVKQIATNERTSVFEYVHDNESRVIKRTNSSYRYYKEIDILRTIKHDNIVKTYEAFTTNNGSTSWIIMEKMDLPVDFQYVMGDVVKIKKITKAVASALKYLHNINIIHNDIKLDNIMIKVVDNQHVIKIIDFGCSQILENGCTWVRRDYWAATLPYVAPETYKLGQYCKQTDIWLLGMTIWFMSESKIAFVDETKGFLKKEYEQFLKHTHRRYFKKHKFIKILKGCLNINNTRRISLDKIIEWCNS